MGNTNMSFYKIWTTYGPYPVNKYVQLWGYYQYLYSKAQFKTYVKNIWYETSYKVSCKSVGRFSKPS